MQLNKIFTTIALIMAGITYLFTGIVFVIGYHIYPAGFFGRSFNGIVSSLIAFPFIVLVGTFL
jgi:hypothetical protein